MSKSLLARLGLDPASSVEPVWSDNNGELFQQQQKYFEDLAFVWQRQISPDMPVCYKRPAELFQRPILFSNSPKLAGIDLSLIKSELKQINLWEILNKIGISQLDAESIALNIAGGIVSSDREPAMIVSLNSAGKYAVKLFYLNEWRRIIVDDLLPVSADGSSLILPECYESGETGIWPILLIKALMKVFSSLSIDFDMGLVLYLLRGLNAPGLKSSDDDIKTVEIALPKSFSYLIVVPAGKGGRMRVLLEGLSKSCLKMESCQALEKGLVSGEIQIEYEKQSRMISVATLNVPECGYDQVFRITLDHLSLSYLSIEYAQVLHVMAESEASRERYVGLEHYEERSKKLENISPGQLVIPFRMNLEILKDTDVCLVILVENVQLQTVALMITGKTGDFFQSRGTLRARLSPGVYTIFGSCKAHGSHESPLQVKLRILSSQPVKLIDEQFIVSKQFPSELTDFFIWNRKKTLFRAVICNDDSKDSFASLALSTNEPHSLAITAGTGSDTQHRVVELCDGSLLINLIRIPANSKVKLEGRIVSELAQKDLVKIRPETVESQSPLSTLSANPKHKKKLSSSASSNHSLGGQLVWQLKMVSLEKSLSLKKDTEKQEKCQALKQAWEVAQPGRSVKAKEIRETYLKSAPVSAPLVPLQPTRQVRAPFSIDSWTRLKQMPEMKTNELVELYLAPLERAKAQQGCR